MERSTAQPAHGARSYVIGFVLAVVLTAIPFALVAFGAMPRIPTLVVVGIAAIAQVLVHLRYFLHLNLSTTPRENILAIAFASVLILILVGGSLWIMFDLHYRMLV
jgi:cytochrome o ubiquinol oxidase operon protein cyoD